MKKNYVQLQKWFIAFCSILTMPLSLLAQKPSVYPINWWVGMQHHQIQLLIKSGVPDSINLNQIQIDYPGVKLLKVHGLDNKTYVAVDIDITAAAKPGIVPIIFWAGNSKQTIQWPLYERRQGNGTQFAQGVNSGDFIYLIMPDRFSNGDPSNDRVPGMLDQSLNRDSIYLRHGGDFKGIINHLDYLQKLGVTALWLTPVIENDEPNRTEHGYSFTNHYKIEPRLGGESMYLELSNELHKRGMKLIQDAVYNHVGSKNIFFLDPPTHDWFHRWPTFTQTSYKDQPLYDPYASAIDKKITSDGWFTQKMPDLNQNNPYVANFLIQHAIWSVEKFGIDGWRIDTYIYNDLDFMNRCNAALEKEYPKITMFGETWVHGVSSQAYFVDNKINIPFKSNLQGATDFQLLFDGILPAVNQPFGWTEGVNRLYSTLAKDFLYTNPMRNVIFLDNHDLSRFFSEVKEDVDKQKMGIAWLLTSRGIPQMYYGTEVLMKGFSNPDGWVRLDFPGGWAGDKKNAFTGEGLNKDELSVQAYTKKLANFRKNSPALTHGKLMQYVPKDGVYVYFRYTDNQTIMCVMNTNEKEHQISWSSFAERTSGFRKGLNVMNDAEVGQDFSVPAKTLMIIELKK
ncbi:glycoside hydrolase family 13 protein [Hydrotalea sandarakina]|uniref:Glycosidase n=1 Tax=Hydrotalea sandarakina TaxID=1004304 RepID=A0A2W7RZ06_9BACT|nr:glycoside hydrolase family 13 protein [Hydrotalea sandarakina]PZX66048.1 glycosidase [Hydrotalea sandarakina]